MNRCLRRRTGRMLSDDLGSGAKCGIRVRKHSIAVITFTGRDGKKQGLGTGFVVDADGLIATNLHVIGEGRPVKVKLADKEYEVTAIHASDRSFDLALLRINAKNLPALAFGDS